MNINKIKEALKARVSSLNLQPVVTTPIVNSAPVVPDKSVVPEKPPIVPQPDKTVLSAQIQPEVKINNAPDKITPHIEGVVSPAVASVVQAEKPARKIPTRKQKEKIELVVPISSATDITLNDIENIIAKHLKAGRDYDKLPNTAKPTLLKSGAEILANVFDFRTTAKVINRIENYDKQFVLYEVCVTVFDKNGNIVAEGLGSCNSRERKYLKTDFATNLNTVLKIAKKRAYVDAILTATHASRVFTQDMEDIANLQIISDNHIETIK